MEKMVYLSWYDTKNKVHLERPMPLKSALLRARALNIYIGARAKIEMEHYLYFITLWECDEYGNETKTSWFPED
jgi:hypothetical protein